MGNLGYGKIWESWPSSYASLKIIHAKAKLSRSSKMVQHSCLLHRGNIHQEWQEIVKIHFFCPFPLLKHFTCDLFPWTGIGWWHLCAVNYMSIWKLNPPPRLRNRQYHLNVQIRLCPNEMLSGLSNLLWLLTPHVCVYLRKIKWSDKRIMVSSFIASNPWLHDCLVPWLWSCGSTQ